MPSPLGEFSVAIDTRRQSLGCTMVPVADKTLRITRISSDGPIWTWNRENPDREIRIGDRIMEVNGVSGNSQSMLCSIRRAQDIVRLRLQPRSEIDIGELHKMMQRRDLTPDDFELLSLLDSSCLRKTAGDSMWSAVESLPRICASKSPSNACSVCLNEFAHMSLVTKLPCGHCYCTQCIATWLTQYKSHCPCCLKAVELEPHFDDVCEGARLGPLQASNISATRNAAFRASVSHLVAI